MTALSSARAQQITGDEVRVSIEAATRWLQSQQRPDGSWPDYPPYRGGSTALATVALLNAGVPPDSDGMRRAIEVVRQVPLEHTYVVALKIQALVAAGPERFRDEIQAATDWLVQAQQESGMWGYLRQGGPADFSNSQFALLGLHEASKAKARIPREVWGRSHQVWVRSQHGDGGWSYRPPSGPSTGSMTAAGLASLYITGNTLAMRKGTDRASAGEPVCCGEYGEFRPIARGLGWLIDNWSVERNPGFGGWYYYYLYGIERVGILSGLRYIGQHDWYREGAARLVRLQKADGNWQESNAVVDTAFALLFLAKGRRPVLVHKLAWSDDQRWNLCRNDLEHLVSFIGDRLGQPMTWETVSLSAELQGWLAAPLLYLNGATLPDLDAPVVEKLRDYVAEGGTILAVGTCTPPEFRKGFTRLAAQAFPDLPLDRLPANHPVFHTVFKLDGSAIELYGLGTGCRTSVFFSPRDIACLWELGNVPDKSQAAFELGTNVAAYATGLEPLPDKLDAVRVPLGSRPADQPSTPPRGAVYLAQLIHNGDWQPNPRAVPKLTEYLHKQLGVDIVPASKPLRATDPEIAGHPIVYMAGHFSFKLSPDEVAALRQHLQRGGFLVANACCGRQAFDTSFRELTRELFPDHPLAPLPPDHPIIAGKPGLPLGQVSYRPSVQAEAPGLNQVRLEAVTVDGRAVIVYSPYSLDCGLDGHACFACRGLAPEDARKVAGNAVLYALSY